MHPKRDTVANPALLVVNVKGYDHDDHDSEGEGALSSAAPPSTTGKHGRRYTLRLPLLLRSLTHPTLSVSLSLPPLLPSTNAAPPTLDDVATSAAALLLVRGVPTRRRRAQRLQQSPGGEHARPGLHRARSEPR